ncbi:MAG TPA: GNAT family N-acetyltransferase [Allosphingosinicella sp.]|jgi:GNAT superfamily N-acetyltransferase
MAGEDDQLREAAKARGFRLVKSRRRKPGGDFGRYGLTDLKTGRECLGFGEDGLTATAQEVHSYLRGGEVAAWKRSLIGVVGSDGAAKPKTAEKVAARPGKSRGAAAPKPAPVKDPVSRQERATPGPSAKSPRGGKAAKVSPPALAGGAGGGSSSSSSRKSPPASPPAPAPSPPPPELTIREATRRDAAALAKLLAIPAASLAERLAAAIRADEPPLIAERGIPVGCCAWTILQTFQEGPRGRITLLVVAEDARRQGIGARLLREAEQRLADAGVASLEISLDIDFDAPTAFLRRTGWQRTTNGYGKPI